jgi:hypothetical protein
VGEGVGDEGDKPVEPPFPTTPGTASSLCRVFGRNRMFVEIRHKKSKLHNLEMARVEKT